MSAAAVEDRFDAAYPAYKRKIETYSRIHFRSIPGMGQQDLEVELQEVLFLTCNAYDPNNGATYNTFFWQAVKNRVIDLKKSAFRQKRKANAYTDSLDEEALRYAVEEATAHPSAEDEILARITVTERFRSGKRNP